MTSPGLDEDVRRLLRRYLDSFEKLEVVRALYLASHGLSVDELVRECHFTRVTLQEALAPLARAKVVERGNAGTVQLGKSVRDPAFESLMETYISERALVLSALSTLAMERIRGLAAHAFADVLGDRKKPEDA